jgi:hypothetical protein
MENSFNLVYKIPDEFRYVTETDGEITRLEDSFKRYFAKQTGVLFREFVKNQNCRKIKYGVYSTDKEDTGIMFLNFGNKIKSILEQKLFDQELQAKRSRDIRRLNLIEKRKEYLMDNWNEIKPHFIVQVVSKFKKGSETLD